jgi:hypothetical protein
MLPKVTKIGLEAKGSVLFGLFRYPREQGNISKNYSKDTTTYDNCKENF